MSRDEGHAALARLDTIRATMERASEELLGAMVAENRAEMAWEQARLGVVVSLAFPEGGAKPVASDAREAQARLNHFELYHAWASARAAREVISKRVDLLKAEASIEQTRVSYLREEMGLAR